MHRVLQVVVLWAFLAGFGFSAGAQSILDGEFGSARKPLREAGETTSGKDSKPQAKVSAPGSADAGVYKPGLPATLAEARGEGEKIPAGSKRYPYHGRFDRVGPDGGNIVLAGKTKERVILITSRTNITRDGRRVSVKEAVKGERVSGTVVKNA